MNTTVAMLVGYYIGLIVGNFFHFKRGDDL